MYVAPAAQLRQGATMKLGLLLSPSLLVPRDGDAVIN
jgi:hypothetical protein